MNKTAFMMLVLRRALLIVAKGIETAYGSDDPFEAVKRLGLKDNAVCFDEGAHITSTVS